MALPNYGIKADYQINPGPVYFHDDVTTTRGIVFQPCVYTFAEWASSIRCFGYDATIVDVGCGWGDKLAAMHERHPKWTFYGIDYGANIEHCRNTYDWGTWLDVELETVGEGELAYSDCTIICSDVIEHLVNPMPLVRALVASKAATIILSTPERDVQYGYSHMGPSTNLCHVREWNAQELKAFLESEGLTIDHIGLTRGNDQGWAMGTILVVAH